VELLGVSRPPATARRSLIVVTLLNVKVAVPGVPAGGCTALLSALRAHGEVLMVTVLDFHE
jgi:hypothetical protein